MIDLHAHILPNVDDTARSLADSRAIARAAAAEGVEAVAATPHVRHDYPTTAEEMEAGVETLRADFAREEIPVRILHGGELDLAMLADLDAATLARFTLGQSGRYLLVRVPVHRLAVRAQAADLVASRRRPDPGARTPGAKPLGPAETRASGRARAPRRGRPGHGCLGGRPPRPLVARRGVPAARARHGRPDRERCAYARHPNVGLAAALAELRDDVLGCYLTCEAPAAIVAGEPLPDRPPTRRRRRFFSLR